MKRAVLFASIAFGASALDADTIFLKDGLQILDCRVTSETDERVTVETPSGTMVVPRSKIFRIARTKTVHDVYKDQLARIHPRDLNGFYKLAQWCRTRDGLRNESDEVLRKIIAKKPDHAGARRLLGHIQVGGKWVVPEPLAVRFNVESVTGVSKSDLETKLGLFLKTREDLRVTSGDVSDDKPLDHCTLNVNVIATRKSAGTFYGLRIGKPSYAALVRLAAKSEWAKGNAPKATVSGMVPASGGTMALAVQNALGGNSRKLHKFLDDLMALRCKALEQEHSSRKRS